MRKRSSIDSPGDMGKFTRSLARLVTGNPIAENYSPPTKDKDPSKNPPSKLSAKRKNEIAGKAPKLGG